MTTQKHISTEYQGGLQYIYTAGNPVMLVDPDGRNTIKMDESHKDAVNNVLNIENNSEKSYTRQDFQDAFEQNFNDFINPLNNQKQVSQQSIADDYLGLYLVGTKDSKLSGKYAATMAVASAYVNEEESELWNSGIWKGNDSWKLFETDNPNIPKDSPMKDRHIFPAIIIQTKERIINNNIFTGNETIIQGNEYMIITFEIVLIPEV